MAFERYNNVSWTADDLLTDVRLEAAVPSDSSDYSDSVVLQLASEIVWTVASSGLAKDHSGGRFIRYTERTINTDHIASEPDLYALPAFAVGQTITHVTVVDSNGAERDLEPIETGTGIDIRQLGNSEKGTPHYYSIEDDTIRLHPEPQATNTDTLRIYYQRRRSSLALTSSCMQITSVTDGDGDLQIAGSSIPSSWPSPDYRVDIVGQYSPHRHEYLDIQVDSESGGTTLVSTGNYSAINGYLNTGSYACLSGTSCYVQLPVEMRRPVTKLVAAEILDQLGDYAGSNHKVGIASRMLGAVQDVAQPRVKRQRPLVLNHHSLMRAGRRPWRGPWGGG